MKKVHRSEPLFKFGTGLLAWSVVFLALLLVVVTGKFSLPSLQKFGMSFFVSTEWNPVTEDFGALAFAYGTLVSSLMAVLIAVPLSLGIALYLAELGPLWIRGPLNFMIELLAAIPSVIYGLWGIFVFVPFIRKVVEPALAHSLGFLPLFQGPAYGVGMLSAGMILSIMIIPTIASISREVFSAVPAALKEAAFAIGSTRWEMVTLAILPFGRSGVLGAVILGLGRALGETMAVTMVIGNPPYISLSLFAPAHTMSSVIANEFSEATTEVYSSALMEIGLVLLLLTLVLNVVARILVWSAYKKVEGAVV